MVVLDAFCTKPLSRVAGAFSSLLSTRTVILSIPSRRAITQPSSSPFVVVTTNTLMWGKTSFVLDWSVLSRSW